MNMGFWSWLTGHDEKEVDVYANFDKVATVVDQFNTISTTKVNAAQENFTAALQKLNSTKGLNDYVGTIDLNAYDPMFTALSQEIAGLGEQMTSKADSIKTYNEAKVNDPLGVFGSTVCMALCNVGEGILSVGEDLLDGAASIVGWVGGLFGAKDFQQDCANFIQKDLARGVFSGYYDSDFAKKSLFTEDSAIAGGFKIVGKTVGYLYAGGVLSRFAGAAGLGTTKVGTLGLKLASGSTWGMTVAGALGGLGNGTESGLQGGLSYNKAMGVGVVSGLIQGGLSFVGGKASEYFQSAANAASNIVPQTVGIAGVAAGSMFNQSVSNSVPNDAANAIKDAVPDDPITYVEQPDYSNISSDDNENYDIIEEQPTSPSGSNGVGNDGSNTGGNSDNTGGNSGNTGGYSGYTNPGNTTTDTGTTYTTPSTIVPTTPVTTPTSIVPTTPVTTPTTIVPTTPVTTPTTIAPIITVPPTTPSTNPSGGSTGGTSSGNTGGYRGGSTSVINVPTGGDHTGTQTGGDHTGTQTGVYDTPQHTGGSYDENGFTFSEGAISNELQGADKLLELDDLDGDVDSFSDEDSALDNIINSSKYSKIPTSTTPSSTKKKGSSSVIPIAAGLSVAAAAGIGAKAYLDRKNNNDFDDDEEYDDEYSDDSFEDDDFAPSEWLDEEENFKEDFSDPESKDLSDDYYDNGGSYSARSQEELADLQ